VYRLTRTGPRLTTFEKFIYPYFIETLIAFVLLSIAYSVEFYSRGILNGPSLDSILRASAQVSVVSVLIVRLTKLSVFTVISFLSVSLAKEKKIKFDTTTVLTEVFISLAIILVTMPVRPIVQEIIYVGEEVVFNNVFAKFYSLPSMIVLLSVGIPLMFLAIKKTEGIYRKVYIFGIIAAIGIVGFLNSGSNYLGRIYDARAYWIKKDWGKTMEEAQLALKDAKTDEERCTAYYWLGVASNRQRDLEKVIYYQSEAIKICPNYGAPYSSLSTAYTMLGNFYAAKVSFEKCIKLNPEYPWCYYAAGAYYDYTGDEETAFEYIKKAYEMAPEEESIKSVYEFFQKQYTRFE
jgi:hypothetical protein